MKTFINFLFLLMPLLSFSQEYSHPKVASGMGLIAELMSVKMNAEIAASMVLSDTTDLVTTKDKKEVMEEYTQLRVLSIPVIAQLIADISKNNSLKMYKRLDDMLSQEKIQEINTTGIKNTKIRTYLDNIKLIHNTLIQFYSKAYDLSHRQISNPKQPAVGDFIGIFTAIETAVKDFNEAKGKKIDKMVEILDATKIADINELSEGSKIKKDKKGSGKDN